MEGVENTPPPPLCYTSQNSLALIGLRQLHTSDHRFRAISALISAASLEKMDRSTKLRTTSGTISTSRIAHLVKEASIMVTYNNPVTQM